MTEVRAADLRLRGAADGGWRAALDPPEPGAASWPSLAAALRELADLLGVEKGGGGGGGQLVVALMPPLTEVRRLDLPPLRDDELHRLLSRNASRYFLNAREAQIVGTATGRRRGRGAVGPDPIVGAAASARLIAAIENAARDAGWTIDAIVPAEAGWRTAAVTLWPAFNKGVSHLLVHHGDRTDVLRLEEGRLAGVRRFRGGAADADLITERGSQSRDNGTAPRVAAIGTRALRDDLTRVLTGRGAIISAPPGDWTNGVDDAALVAASFAVAHEELALRTEAALVARAQRSRFATVYVAAAAVVLLAAAAWTELWGVRRELAAVQAKRDQIKPRLETTLVGAHRAPLGAGHRDCHGPSGPGRLSGRASGARRHALARGTRGQRGPDRRRHGRHPRVGQRPFRGPGAARRATRRRGARPVHDRGTVDSAAEAARSRAAARSSETGSDPMRLPSLSASERRTVLIGGLAVGLPLLYVFAIKPYRTELTALRGRLDVAREALARESAAVRASSDNPLFRRALDSATDAMSSRLFVGHDDVAASAELSSYLAGVARKSHVLVQSAGTRAATISKTGVRTLRVELRGESDLSGVLDFLDALDHGDRLVRVERLEISRPVGGDEVSDVEALTISATINGFALGEPPTPSTRPGAQPARGQR
jgi:hypothetical protein